MGEEEAAFGALVVAGVTMLIGTKLLVGSMIELISVNGGTGQLLLGSVPGTTTVAICLLMVTGSLLSRLWWSRSLALVTLAVVAVLGRPVLADPEPIALGQTVIAVVTITYLLVANPVKKQERSNIDESSSASRVGSTIR
jgi:lysylphosphatidylglycerol synthetase-like protein (DUF2156 family)